MKNQIRYVVDSLLGYYFGLGQNKIFWCCVKINIALRPKSTDQLTYEEARLLDACLVYIENNANEKEGR